MIGCESDKIANLRDKFHDAFTGWLEIERTQTDTALLVLTLVVVAERIASSFSRRVIAYEEPPANSRRIRRPPPPRMGTHWSD